MKRGGRIAIQVPDLLLIAPNRINTDKRTQESCLDHARSSDRTKPPTGRRYGLPAGKDSGQKRLRFNVYKHLGA